MSERNHDSSVKRMFPAHLALLADAVEMEGYAVSQDLVDGCPRALYYDVFTAVERY